MAEKKEEKTTKKTRKTSPKYIFAVGRRKTASARVRLFRGKGKIVVNNKPIESYFPGVVAQTLYSKPFRVNNVENQFEATVRVVGSGKMSQLIAVVHGLARALDKSDREKYHQTLKKNGLLTRDSRERERRKAGLAGKARHHKQSPKR